MHLSQRKTDTVPQLTVNLDTFWKINPAMFQMYPFFSKEANFQCEEFAP